jgi:hypothetical protein
VAARPVGAAPAASGVSRRRQLLNELQGRRLEDAYLRSDIRQDILAEAQSAASDPDALLGLDSVQLLEEIIAARRTQERPLVQARSGASRELARTALLSSATAVIVPGFLASQLSDKAPHGHGLIWVNPFLDPFSDRLTYLKLGPLGADLSESDADPTVQILPDGPLPIVYDLLRGALETSLFGPRYWTNVYAFDWRRNLEDAAHGLVVFLQSLKEQAPNWPIHLIAHSQGALVARKAIELLGPDADALPDDLVLLGPANYGSLAAVRGLGNEVTEIDFVRKFAVEPPAGFNSVLATFSGLYQLIPSNAERVPWLARNNVFDPGYWNGFPIDASRLATFHGWAEHIDTRFFDDRTTIILGDNNGAPTAGGVVIEDGVMRVDDTNGLAGDGTIPHSCAVLPGVATYLAADTEHSRLPTYRSVISAVKQVLAGQDVSLPAVSSQPGDYTRPLPMAAEALRAAREARAVVSQAPGAGAPGSAFEQVVSMAAEMAKRTGTRIKIDIDVEPR